MIVKQMDIRANIKKYFDMAYSGIPIVVPRKDNRNVVIISEEEYNRISRGERLGAYSAAITSGSEKGNAPAEAADDVRSFNLKKIEAIAGLKKDWNGNGAPSFSKKMIRKVTDIVNTLIIQPEVFPTAMGTIQLEFDNSRRDHMEIEITPGDTAEIFTVTYDGRELFDSIPADTEDLNRRISSFYG
ncbi:MAG: type II toxin-antitoxin system Phd/YefM family antitoxin [Lachnospiraceae bacterium]|nr:type II toxin-antitoxin system Phd/YefM family antitoxin [Lachnospiraceae bacterium]